MDSFEWNKIIGAVLGTVIFIFVVRLVAEAVYEPEIPAKPGYHVEGVVEASAGGTAAAPAEEVIPDWGTVLPTANVADGKSISARCEQCHNLAKGGPNLIGPNLYSVVGRARATHPGFDYSSAMKAKGGNWTYDELFKFLKSPGSYIPGTKMSFAGLSHPNDRVNLIAYLRSNADSPEPIPAPAPKTAAPATPAAGPTAGGTAPTAAAKGDAAPAKAAPGATPGNAAADKAAAPATAAPAEKSAAPAPKSNLAPGKTP